VGLTDMPGQDSPENNKRVAQRQRVLKQGKMLFSNNMTLIDCTIRDLSTTGAKLLCADPGAIPNEFRLVFIAERQMRDVKVVWRRPDMIGVHFTSELRKAPLLKW
jgi:hypothetical protein